MSIGTAAAPRGPPRSGQQDHGVGMGRGSRAQSPDESSGPDFGKKTP